MDWFVGLIPCIFLDRQVEQKLFVIQVTQRKASPNACNLESKDELHIPWCDFFCMINLGLLITLETIQILVTTLRRNFWAFNSAKALFTVDLICHVTCDLISLVQISEGRIYPHLYLEMDCWLCCKSIFHLIISYRNLSLSQGMKQDLGTKCMNRMYYNPPSPWKAVRTTGVYVPHSLQTAVRGLYNITQESEQWKSCEKMPLIFCPHLRD